MLIIASQSTLLLQKHLEEFACEGLRTLVLGVKDLSKEEWEAWRLDFKQAQEALNKRDEKLTACASLIERGMTIVGATAIEDKLQDVSVWVYVAANLHAACGMVYVCESITLA
jgi:magnesium-transporting ATPase (P-type)